MKIAVASEKGQVTQHFGHCEGFVVFQVEEGNITGRQELANPGHRPGFLPNYLGDQGINVIISGGMGGGAVAIFNERQIEVVTGARGDAELAAQAYLSGDLKSTNVVCNDHAHHGGHHGHSGHGNHGCR